MTYGSNQSNNGKPKHWMIGAQVDTNKVLDSHGNWTLEKIEDSWVKFDSPGTTYRSRYTSLIKHRCYTVKEAGPDLTYQVVVYADDTSHCWRCDEEIPDKMEVLWRFMNHDQIEYRKRFQR